MKTESVKKKTASEEHSIMDNASLKAKLDVWDKFCEIKDCENNIIIGFGACKQCHKVLVFDC